ncbi:MAG TPA: enoyl-CoA hydratase-related protein [Trebonia sp.]|nr:enoyl-CoA hydratase-related protein [Trebonia sp.]
MSDVLIRSDDGAVTTLTLNRPAERNAINDELREAFLAALDEVSADPAVRVVIVTGNGKSFCAGGDVRAMRERLQAPAGQVAFDGWRRQQRTGVLAQALHSLGVVTIAAVNGHAIGLGLDLALACDFVVAAPQASFAASFVKRGLIPDGGGLYYLPRRVGLQKAKELMYSGRSVDAAEAARIGIADVLAADGALLTDACAYAGQFTAQPRASITLMKSIVNRTYELSLESVAALGSQAQAICYTTEDHRASVESFLAGSKEKGKP